jgi:hypothetical protein
MATACCQYENGRSGAGAPSTTDEKRRSALSIDRVNISTNPAILIIQFAPYTRFSSLQSAPFECKLHGVQVPARARSMQERVAIVINMCLVQCAGIVSTALP